jgi:hypothetical protein
MLVLVATASLPAAAQSRPSHVDALHANAVESFRSGRFSEAYGRFVALADAGHAASARYALWMCEHGLELFGKDWDCSPQEVQEWAQAAGVAAPAIGPRSYVAARSTRQAARR